jgi:hypothetical protein
VASVPLILAPTLVLKQPWATLVALGVKDVENRAWRSPNMVGRDLLICAGLKVDSQGPPVTSPIGPGIVAVVRVLDIVRCSRSSWATPGAWHWLLGDVERFQQPLAVRGMPGLFSPAPNLAEALALTASAFSQRVSHVGLRAALAPLLRQVAAPR